MRRGRKQVVFIMCWTLRIGGVERKIADIARCLAAERDISDYEVYLVLAGDTPDQDTTATFYPQIADAPIKRLYVPKVWLHRYRMTIGLYTLWQSLWLKPVVIFAFMRQLGLISTIVKKLLFWRSIKVYISEDTHASSNLIEETPDLMEREAARIAVKRIYPWSDLVIAPSDASRLDLWEYFGVPLNKVEVVKNWIPFRSTPGGEASPDFDLVYVGRVAKVKDLPFLLKAVSILKERRPRVRLCLVGDGDDMRRVIDLVEALELRDNVSLEGFQTDVLRFVRRGRVFCITSLYEGLPMTVLEAMSQGLPVVARNYFGAEELVREGVTGFVCDTPEAMAEKIDRILDSEELWAVLGRNARTLVETEHGPGNLRRYVALILNRE